MSHRRPIIRLASIGAYFVLSFCFVLSFATLYWFAGDSYFCARSPLRSTFRLSVGCTIWDLFACVVGSWLDLKVMNLRTAAPLLAGVITGAGLASMPFWIYRGYGHFPFEGTWTDISCFFTEANGLAFPFVVAPALGLLTLIHGIFWLRISKGPSIAVALTV